MVENTIPVLPVKNLAQSMTFYIESLGFTEDWRGGLIGSVSRDGCCIMLSEMTGMSNPGWVWIGVRDDSVFEDYRALGVKVRQEPRNFVWAYEMKFEDPDGNVLWLGTETRKDLPVE